MTHAEADELLIAQLAAWAGLPPPGDLHALCAWLGVDTDDARNRDAIMFWARVHESTPCP